MADSLIETYQVNPYEWIVADTSTQITDLDADIQKITKAINDLEKVYPTSTTLQSLRDQLAELQAKKNSLSETNSSAKALSQSFNQWQQNVNTLKWIYDIKQEELAKAKAEDEATYKRMIDETRRNSQNYINALWNATASENAIINANAWMQWASQQSTAEARARNYLQNAQAQAEAANTATSNINNLEQARMNSNQWYTQLSQSNADNYLRQQVLSDMEAAENEKTRQAQYWWYWYWWWWGWGWWGSSSRWWYSYWWWSSKWKWSSTSSRWTDNVIDPNEEFWNPQDISEYEKELQKAKEEAEKYWKWTGDTNMFVWTPDTRVLAWSTVWMPNQISLDTTYIPKPVVKEPEPVKNLGELDRYKINNQIRNSWLDQNTITYQLTDKWYVMFKDWKWNTKYVDANSLRR